MAHWKSIFANQKNLGLPEGHSDQPEGNLKQPEWHLIQGHLGLLRREGDFLWPTEGALGTTRRVCGLTRGALGGIRRAPGLSDGGGHPLAN